MTALFRPQRRAEHFDSLLEGDRPDEVDRQTAELLALVGALRSLPEVQARPGFVADLREQLMLAAETELSAAPAAPTRDDVDRLTVKPIRTRRERRIGLALGAFAIVGATTSMAVASQSALPGDALYPFKRAIENTQAGFSVGDDAKGETILGNASGRLDEVDQLTRQPNPDAALVTETLNTFSEQASEAGDLLLEDYEQNGHEESIKQLHAFTTHSVDVLGALQAAVPDASHSALLNAAQTVFTLDAAAEQVCPDCGDGITEIPPQLASATSALDDATGALAGGELPGTTPPGTTGEGGHQIQGGKDSGRPSGLNPPENPVTIPSDVLDPSDTTSDTTSGLGDLLPSTSTNTSGGGNNGGGGKGGKGGKNTPVDVTPVTDTVTQVVTEVVEGVNGILTGLTGGQ